MTTEEALTINELLHPKNERRVRVYFNLHKKCLSVQTKTEKGWRVAAHVNFLCLKQVAFKVSEAGRQMVLKQKKKNVHAFIEGNVCAWGSIEELPSTEVTYNPYLAIGKFHIKGTNKVVDHADTIIISGKNIMINEQTISKKGDDEH